jgi:hypothetical protein
MLDGYFNVYDGYRGYVGYRHTRGFDRMKNGETVVLRFTKHVPKFTPEWMGSLTSEVVNDTTPWVIEP